MRSKLLAGKNDNLMSSSQFFHLEIDCHVLNRVEKHMIPLVNNNTKSAEPYLVMSLQNLKPMQVTVLNCLAHGFEM